MCWDRLGLLALLLSAAGVFGVVTLLVASRTRELGLRMAIGATRGQIVRSVPMDGVRLSAGSGWAGGFRWMIFAPSKPLNFVDEAVL